MTKKDLKLITSFIDLKDPKIELHNVLVKDGALVATDTSKIIKFVKPQLKASGFIHKNLLKGLESSMSKDEVATVNDDCISSGAINLRYDNYNSMISKDSFPDTDAFLDTQMPFHFQLESISDIQFELAQRSCYIDDLHLKALITLNECNFFDVFYEQQQISKTAKHSGRVKIVGQKEVEDELKVYFVAYILGRTFESQADE